MLTFYINLTFHAYFVCVVLFTYPNIQISMNELSCLSSLMLSCLVHLGLHAYFRRACLLLLALPVLHSFAATLAASLAACALGASALTEPWLALGCHVLSDPLCHAVSGTLTHPTERTRNRPHVDVRAVGREPGPDPTFGGVDPGAGCLCRSGFRVCRGVGGLPGQRLAFLLGGCECGHDVG